MPVTREERYLMSRHSVWAVYTHHLEELALCGGSENHLRLKSWVEVETIHCHCASSTVDTRTKQKNLLLNAYLGTLPVEPQLQAAKCWLRGWPDEGILGLDAGDVWVFVVGVADRSFTNYSINVQLYFALGRWWLRWCPTSQHCGWNTAERQTHTNKMF